MNYFDTIPDELIAIMIRNMDAESYMGFQRTCKRMHDLSKNKRNMPYVTFTIRLDHITSIIHNKIKNKTIKYNVDNYVTIAYKDAINAALKSIPKRFRGLCYIPIDMCDYDDQLYFGRPDMIEGI